MIPSTRSLRLPRHLEVGDAQAKQGRPGLEAPRPTTHDGTSTLCSVNLQATSFSLNISLLDVDSIALSVPITGHQPKPRPFSTIPMLEHSSARCVYDSTVNNARNAFIVAINSLIPNSKKSRSRRCWVNSTNASSAITTGNVDRHERQRNVRHRNASWKVHTRNISAKLVSVDIAQKSDLFCFRNAEDHCVFCSSLLIIIRRKQQQQ